MLGAGFVVLILADVALAFASGIWAVFLGIGLWGLHMGMTQGRLAALVADISRTNLRGTAFGLFNLATGVAVLLASLIAGPLWEAIGPSTAFLSGAALTAIGLVGAFTVIGRR